MKIFSNYNFLKLLFIFFFITQSSVSNSQDSIGFSGGVQLSNYQPSLIVPLLREAFKQNGIKFHAKHNPSLRSLQLSNSGKVDGELHRVYEFQKISSGKYQNLLRIESKLLSVWLAAFSNKNLKIKRWADLKDYKVIYYRGRKNVENLLSKVLAPENIITVNTDEQAFNMLLAGRADIVISESRQAKKVLTANPKLSEIFEIAKLRETKIYAYIHKKHKKIGIKVAKTLEKMKEDGSFYKIVAKVNKAFK